MYGREDTDREGDVIIVYRREDSDREMDSADDVNLKLTCHFMWEFVKWNRS